MKLGQYIAALLASACLAACGGGNAEDTPRTMQVNGTTLDYRDNRAAAPTIVFLHGAVTDLRMWDAHRALAEPEFRTVAYTQRYHGTGPWAANWPPYGVNTHSRDLTAFVEQLGAGPVHLVAWSYAGHIAFDAALRRPDLFRSVYVYEPGATTYVSDPAEFAAWAQDAGQAFGPVFGAVRQGDDVQALKLLLDASSSSTGYFATQSAAAQRMELDNARTMSELLLRQEAPPEITCAQLGTLRVPTRVGYGGTTRPQYAVTSRAAQRCVGGTGHFVVEGRNHMWPMEDPAAFTRSVLDFVRTR